MLNGVAKSNGGHHSNAMKDTDMVELSRSNSSENSLDVNGVIYYSQNWLAAPVGPRTCISLMHAFFRAAKHFYVICFFSNRVLIY